MPDWQESSVGRTTRAHRGAIAWACQADAGGDGAEMCGTTNRHPARRFKIAPARVGQSAGERHANDSPLDDRRQRVHLTRAFRCDDLADSHWQPGHDDQALSDAWIEFTALQQVISDDKLYQLWQAAAPPSAVNDSLDRAAVAESLHQAAREIEQRIRQRWVHIGSLQRRILEGNVTVPILDAGPTLHFEASSAEPAMLKMLAGLNGRPGPDIAFAKLHERYEQHRNNRPIVTERNIRLSFLVANLPLLVLIAWCAVTRGGLPYLLLGVRIVRENGRPLACGY